jgi:hypothetical protein
VGPLYDLVQERIDRTGYRVSQRQVAQRLGAPRQKHPLARHHLGASSELVDVPHRGVLHGPPHDIAG